MAGPLDGYRILELTSTVSGPMAGMILADQGADVIKIEPPLLGDLARFMGDIRNGVGAMFATLNRNKRSLVLDLKQAEDLAVFMQLVPTADVLIENYRPGIVARLGIDYASLAALNPGLIYVSISGYGQSGPYKQRRVYDPLIQATAGMAAEQDAQRPSTVRTIIFDKVTGYTAAQAVTAALLQRAKTGEGQYLPISMLQSALYYLWPDLMWSHTFLEKGSSDSGTLADYFQIYKTADGAVAIVLVAETSFVQLCELLGIGLHEDPAYAGFAARRANRDALQGALDEALADWTCADLCDALDQRDVPAARVNTLEELPQDPQIVEQQCLKEIVHPVAGRMRIADTPFKFARQNPLPARHSPTLGQHSAEILTELGVDPAHIERIETRERSNAELTRSFSLSQVE